MANVIPTEIWLQNFKSYINMRIPLYHGEESERCFITGSSGKGKSSILEAMQFVLGKPFQNDKEFFNYEEQTIGGKKQNIYKELARIELSFLNRGPGHIAKYPKDSIIIIGLEATRRKKYRRRYIRHPNGTVENIYLADLEQFGRFFDPFTFIDDEQTNYWSRAKPKERYNKVAEFMGITDFRKNVKQARKEFLTAGRQADIAESALELAKVKLDGIEKDYNRFEVKREIIEQIEKIDRKLCYARIFEANDSYEVQESQFYEQLKEKQELATEIGSLKSTINTNRAHIKRIQKETTKLIAEKKSLEAEQGDLIFHIKDYERNLNKNIETITAKGLELPSQADQKSLEPSEEELTKQIENTTLALHPLRGDLREKIKLLDLRKKNIIHLGPDTKRLTSEMRKVGIKYDLLYESLEFIKGKEKWIDYIELLFNITKFGVVVNEEDRERAEEINRSLNLNAVVLSPREKYVRLPKTTLRNWTHILKIDPQQVRGETLTSLLHLMLGNTYFAKNPLEKEEFLNQAPRSRILCLDGYQYNIYSQQKFLKKKPTYVIGKGAKQKEINRIAGEIRELESKIKKLTSSLNQYKGDLTAVEVQLEYLKTILEEDSINLKRKRLEQNNIRLEHLYKDLADPQGQIEVLQTLIDEQVEKQTNREQYLKDLHISLQNLTKNLETSAKEFYQRVTEWQTVVVDEKFEEDLTKLAKMTQKEFIGEYAEEEYEYIGIHINIKPFLKSLIPPEEGVQELEKQLYGEKRRLNDYKDVTDAIVAKFKQTKDAFQEAQKLLKRYVGDMQKCREEFNIAKDNLENELSKWQKNVNRKLTTILQGLELDGQMSFDKSPEVEGEYELNLNVANKVGGATAPIEGFSRGEKLRVSLAFEMAILTQSESPYFVWDEFDRNLGDDHRELLAKMIDKHLPNRKLIAISPRRLLRGYTRIFPTILDVMKDDNQCSLVSLMQTTEDIKKRGDLSDVT